MCVQCILTLVDENTSSPIAYRLTIGGEVKHAYQYENY